MAIRHILIIFIGLIFLASCAQDNGGLQQFDLIDRGYPLKVWASDSVIVRKTTFGPQTDLRIEGKDGFMIQVFISNATSSKPSDVIAGIKPAISSNRYFSGFELEQDNGFIYKLQLDENNVSYGFRRVLIKGNKEYIVQNNLLGIKTLEEAEQLFVAVE